MNRDLCSQITIPSKFCVDSRTIPVADILLSSIRNFKSFFFISVCNLTLPLTLPYHMSYLTLPYITLRLTSHYLTPYLTLPYTLPYIIVHLA